MYVPVVVFRLPNGGVMTLLAWTERSGMVVQTQRDDATWFECETCGLLFDEQSDATEHEKHCDGSDPSYIQ